MIKLKKLMIYFFAASVKMNCPIENVLIETSDGFEISTNIDMRLYLDSTIVPEFSISHLPFENIAAVTDQLILQENPNDNEVAGPSNKPKVLFVLICSFH